MNTIEQEFFKILTNKNQEVAESYGSCMLTFSEKYQNYQLEGSLFLYENTINVKLELQNYSDETKKEPIVAYSFVISAVSMLLVFAFAKHSQECVLSESRAKKTSYYTLTILAAGEFLLVIWHMSITITHKIGFDYLLLNSFWNLILYSILNTKLLFIV